MMDANGFRVPTAQGVLVVRQYGIPDLPYDDNYRAQVYKSVHRRGDAYVELDFAAPLRPLPPLLSNLHPNTIIHGGPHSSQHVTLSLE
jgi:hypothetical protein